MKIRNILLTLAGFVAIAFLLAPARIQAAQQTDSTAISDLLLQVKLHADNAERDADTLESYTRSKVHWESHSTQIHSIKRHVNDLIQDSNQLSKLRSEGSPWQQQAIDHINEILPQISTHLSAMIKHLTGNQLRVNSPEFQNYIRTNYELIKSAHDMINDWLEYDEAKSKADALEQKLQLATAQNPG